MEAKNENLHGEEGEWGKSPFFLLAPVLMASSFGMLQTKRGT